MQSILDVIKIEGKELSEQELDALYLYLNMEYDNMADEEKQMWYNILSTIDKDFFDDYEDQSNGPQ